ncbi:hypothetical protein KP509_23G059700 [Ceratopteris richardii]|nr:hypothetical protein KP509_23G059700 [Ceratopteris richardii]
MGVLEVDPPCFSATKGTSLASDSCPGTFSDLFVRKPVLPVKDDKEGGLAPLDAEEDLHRFHSSSDKRPVVPSGRFQGLTLEPPLLDKLRATSEDLSLAETEVILGSIKENIIEGNLKTALEQLESLPIEVRINSDILSLFLKQCGKTKSVHVGRRIHNYIKMQGLQHDTFLGNHIINMYRHCKDTSSAKYAFDDIHRKNVISWTIMISAYAHNGQYELALQLFNDMQKDNVRPDKVTVSTIITACSNISARDQGREIHQMIIDGKLESDVVVESALVNMYVKSNCLEEAQKVFDSMRSRNVVSWTTMILAYAQNNQEKKALNLFEQMEVFGVIPNEFTLVGALSACSRLRSLADGLNVHGKAVYHGYESHIVLGNALIHMYSKFGHWDLGLKVFSKMPMKDVISWTSMLDAYTEEGRTKDTLQLFEEMNWEGIIPDKVTFLSILGACADLLALEQGKRIHASIISRKLHTDQMVGCALIHMYGRCGSVESAREVFDNIQNHNVHTWTSMISVYSQHGLSRDALILFNEMLKEDVKPNEITFVSVLSACSHGGFIAEAFRCFNSLKRVFDITPTAEHYACMVDVLGRAGFLKEAEELLKKMPISGDVVIWRSMLSACVAFNDTQRAKWAAEECIKLQPGYSAPYVMLSNIFVAEDQWEEVARIQRIMDINGVKMQLGKSSIEIKDKIHEFVVDDQAHPQIEQIHAELGTLSKKMEECGYVPMVNTVLHDVEEELKTYMLKYHSERLAIVFGHMMTPSKSTLRIVKNLRMCFDCHCAIKYMSKILEREIIVRDSYCSHHFKDGVCSCLDYW